mmetsp:Transcript_90066/g.241557  ORF Transcript_90066/g.241557 Transcript_90066/m.241557 type:complete len:246 (-) Transcript_90066:96-833(-)
MLMGQGLPLGVVESVHRVGRQVHRTLWESIARLDHDLHHLAVVGEVVVVLHLAAVGREGLVVVQDGAAAPALDLLGAPLARPPRGLLVVRDGHLQGGGLPRGIARGQLRLLLRHGHLRARAEHQGVVVLPRVQQHDAARAARDLGSVVQHAQRLAADDSHLEPVVPREHQDLVLAAPMELVPDPCGVLANAIETEHQGAGRRVRVLQRVLRAHLPQLPGLLPSAGLWPLCEIRDCPEQAAVIIGY